MKVSAVIVTFNRKELLIKTIQSLYNQTRKLDNIYIIDNCSTDNTYEFLVDNEVINDDEFDESIEYIQRNGIYTYIRLPENTGGAGGFSRGIKIAHQEKNDWIWIMDDDIYPHEDAMYNYEKYILESKEELSALMGVRYFEGKAFSFEATDVDFENYSNLSFKKKLVDESSLYSDKAVRIYDFPFEGPIINSRAIDKIGYPEEDFFIIGDDTDYALRLNEVAPSYTIPQVKFERMITPYGQPGEFNKFNWKGYYTNRNIIYLNKKYGKNNKVKYLRTFLIFSRYLLSYIKKSVLTKNIGHLDRLPKIFKAYKDGMSGNLGKKYVPGDF